MTADEIEKYGDVLFDRIEGFQDEVLRTIGRRIKEIGSLSAYDSQTLKNLADITGDMKVITTRLAEVTGMNIKDIQKVYEGVLADTAEKYKPLYDFRNMEFVPFSKSEFGQTLLKHWSEQTAGDMINLSRTKAIGFTDETGNFKSIVGAYQAAVDKAVFNISTGTEDFNTAMRQTVEALGGSGVKTLYKGINKNGVPYTLNVGLDSMVRANLLYGAKQASQAYDEHIGEELGCDGFEVDAHSNPRPTHEFMQGKIYSYSGKKEIDGVTYEDGAAALSALEDYGCLHFKTDVILGVSEPRYGEEYLNKLHKENTELIEYNGVKKTGYEWKQQQRALERSVRREKGVLSIAEASGDKTLAKRSKERITAYKARYNDMCNKLGLQKTPERMATVKSKQNLLTANDKNVIINVKEVGSTDIEIDKFTPCLENAATGEIIPTAYSLIGKEELKSLKGWKFDWNDKSLNDAEIYKLTLKDDDTVQGLVAINDDPSNYAVYLKLAESAPHNIGKVKKYNGVGGHLFAIAAKKSTESGYGGFIYFEAKNRELVRHYTERFGAKYIGGVHEYRMMIDEETAQKLLKKYTLEEEK